VNVTDRLVASMSIHVAPLLPVSEYCWEVQLAAQLAEAVASTVACEVEPEVGAWARRSIRHPRPGCRSVAPPLIVTLTRMVPRTGSKPYSEFPLGPSQIKPMAE